jgi:hypothetical protein
MITLEQYFGKFPELRTPLNEGSATELLRRVNALLKELDYKTINKKTGSLISGTQYGGMRPKSCPEGAENSSHKTAMGVDIFDPDNKLDGSINDIILLRFNLYREHPDHTIGWCHLQTRQTKSGKRTFIP